MAFFRQQLHRDIVLSLVAGARREDDLGVSTERYLLVVRMISQRRFETYK